MDATGIPVVHTYLKNGARWYSIIFQNYLSRLMKTGCHSLIVGLLLTLNSSELSAQTTYDWLNTAPDGNFKQGAGGARWNPGGLWDEPPYGIVQFNNNHQVTMTNNVAGTWSQHKINFGTAATTGRTIGGNPIQLFDFSGTWPFIRNQSSATHTINFPVLVGTGGTWAGLELVNTGGNLDFGGTINNQGKNLYIYGNNTAVDGTNRATRWSGIVSGTGFVNVSQFGVLKLNATHTYTGQTQVDNGELWIESSGSIAAPSAVFVGNGTLASSVAKLWLSNGSGGTTFSNNLTISNGIANTREVGGLNTSGTHTFSGNITNNSTTGGALLSAVNAGGSVTFSGVLSGTGAYTTQGAGTITFSGASANTYTGATTVNAGTLVLNKTAGVIAIPTNTTIAAGATIRTDAANQWGTGTPPLVTINGNGILNLNNNNQRIALASASATASVTLGSATLDINNTGTDTYAGVISGTGGVTKTNTGVEILTNTTNSYTGATTITGGEIRLNPSANATFASPMVLNGGTLSTGGITTGRTWTSSSTLNLNANSVIALASGDHTITFNASNLVTWSGTTLTINGWTGTAGQSGTGGRIFVGSNSSGLLPAQLDKIQFTGYPNGADILSTGEIVPRCSNPAAGGTIASGQTICSGGDPLAFTSPAAASGQVGTIEYRWQFSSTSDFSSDVHDIPSSNSATYDAPSGLTATRYYRRQARVTCRADWAGAAVSNIITVTVRPVFTSGTIVSTGETICSGGNPSQIGSSTAASGGDEVITYSWRSSADGYTNAIPGATSATYTPPGGLTVTTSYRRYANDGTCNTTPTVSAGTRTVTVTTTTTSIAPSATQNIPVSTNGTTLTVAEGTNVVNSRVWKFGTTSGGPYPTSTGVTATSYTPNFTSAATYFVVCETTYGGPCNATINSNQVQVTVTSNTITTGTVSGSPFCTGASFSVPFTYTPASNFPNGTTTFTAQLSNASGSFATPTTLGSLASNGSGNQTISGLTIPLVPAGTGYRIRVVSNNPLVDGSDNGTNLTIQANNTAGAPSSTPVVCVNTAITSITHSTTGATGISNPGVSGANELPAGVSATWAANTITIIGTPTGSGTFNYSIPLTGGCGSVSAAGTITVNSAAAITGQPSNATLCSGGTASFSVTASGSSPTYAWRRRGAGWNTIGTPNAWALSAGSGGFFRGPSTNNGGGSGGIDIGGNSWGIFNNGSTATEAIRDFAGMTTGQVFQVDMDNGFVNGTVGFSLRNSGNQNMVEFYFRSGQSFYEINRNGGAEFTGLAYTPNGIRVTLTVTSPTTYSMTVQGLNGGLTFGPYTGTFINTGTVSRFRGFSVNNGSGGNFDLFFNRLHIGPIAAPALYEDDASNYSGWSNSDNFGHSPLHAAGPFSGVASATLTINPATSAQAGNYDVVVYNSCGGVTSSAASLTITAPGTWIGSTNTDWHTTSNWSCNTIPINTTAVVIPFAAPRYPVISTGDAAVASLTIASGASVEMSGTRSLAITAGGSFANSGTFTRGTGTVEFLGNGTISGSATTFHNVIIRGAVDFGNSLSTIDGTLTRAAGGSVSNNAPRYTANSRLLYTGGGTVARGLEWSHSGSPVLGTSPGYPNDVQFSNNTTFDYPNNAGNNTTSLLVARDLIIDNGSSFFMDFGAGLSAGTVAVGRDFLMRGNVSLGDGAGGNLLVGRNFEKTGGAWNGNGRELIFNGSGTQTFSSNDNITIQTLRNNNGSPNALSINSNLTIGTNGGAYFNTNGSRTTVSSGVTISFSDGTTLETTNGITTVNGTLLSSGTTGLETTTSTSFASLKFSATGVFNHNATRSGTGWGVIPAAEWQSGSLCTVTGITGPSSGNFPGGIGQTFSNFTWNTPAMTASPNIGGQTIICTGTFTLAGTGTGAFILTNNSTGAINTANYAQTGGTLNMSNGSGTGTLECSGTFNFSAGTITESSSGRGLVLFDGNANQNVSVNGTISNVIDIRVNNSNAGFGIVVSGTLPVGNGATFFRTQGTVSGTVGFNQTLSTLAYDGSSAIVSSNGEWPATNGPVNVTISNPSGITLHASREIPGILTFSAGLLHTSATNLLTVTNMAAGAVTGFSAASYVNGPLARRLTTGNTYTFPLGKSSRYHPAELSAVTGANPVVRFEVADPAGAATFDANTLTSVSGSEYWEAALLSGTFSSGSLSLTRSGGLSGNSSIARSVAAGGSYNNLGSSGTSGNTVLGSLTGSSIAGFYRLAVPKPVFFRSITNGLWHIPATWQASNTSNFAATFAPLAPPSASNSDTIIIQNGHTVTITAGGGPITLDQTQIQANGVLIWDEGTLIVNNGAGVDVQVNGTFDDENSADELPSFINANGNATMAVANGGRILISSNGEDARADGYASNEHGIQNNVIWQNGSVFEWQSTLAFSASGITFFPNADQATIPVFRISANLIVPFDIGIGGTDPTVINGLLEANGTITWGYGGTKTFRNGITGTGAVTQGVTCGNFIFNGATSKLGGTGVLNLNTTVAGTDGLQITNGIDSLISDKVVNSASGKSIRVTSSNATFHAQAFQLSGTAGYSHTTDASTFITAHPDGVNGTLGGLNNALISFANNVNFSFEGMGNQVTGSLMGTVVFNLIIQKTNAADQVILSRDGHQVTNLILNRGSFGAGAGNRLQFGDGSGSTQPNTLQGIGPNGQEGTLLTNAQAGELRFTNYTDIIGDSRLQIAAAECRRNNAGSGVRFLTSLNETQQTANVATITGYIKLNPQGFISRAPLYAQNSLLIYSNGGSFNRTTEWGNVPNAPGYPWHVTVESGTTLNLGGNPVSPDSLYMGGDLRIGTSLFGSGTVDMGGMVKPFSIGGNLIVGSGNASGVGTFTMNNVSIPVLVKGNVEIGADGAAGSNLNLSSNIGGDLWVGASYIRNDGSSFNHNNREIFFFGGTNGSVHAPSPGPETFPFVIVDKGGSPNHILTLNRAVNISQRLTLSSGRVVTSDANILTITNTTPDIGPGNAQVDVGDTSMANNNGYVDGPMRRLTNNTSGNDQRYLFPVGTFRNSTHYYKRMWVRNVQNNPGGQHFTVRYFRDEPPLKPAVFLFAPPLIAISAQEYWQVDRQSGSTAEARIQLPYRVSDNTWFDENRSSLAPPTNQNVAIARGMPSGNPLIYNYSFAGTGSVFSNFPPIIEAISRLVDGDVVSRNITGFSPFTFGMAFSQVLPVRLLSFGAALQGTDAHLNWTIDDPEQLLHVEVQHSTDGQRFALLATVPASGRKEYQYRHTRLAPGVHHYRLRLIARDGSASYSRVEVVMVNTAKTLITGLQQNPVKGGEAVVRLYSARTQQAEAVLYDMAGRMLLRQKLTLQPGINQAAVSLRMVPDGFYQLHLRTSDGVEKVMPLMK